MPKPNLNKRRGPKPKAHREKLTMGPNMVRELQELRSERDDWARKAKVAIASGKSMQAEALKRVGQVSAKNKLLVDFIKDKGLYQEFLSLGAAIEQAKAGDTRVEAAPESPGN